MRHTTPRPAALPLRALIVALLTGFGLWQAWTCTDGMMASPVAATTMTTAMTATTGHAEPTGHGEPAHAIAGEEPSPGMPAGMAGLCIAVLASLAGALILMSSPLKLVGLVRRLGEFMLRPVDVSVGAPALIRLCVSRT